MKSFIITLLVLLFASYSSAWCAHHEETSAKGSKEFESIKSLVGIWEGTVDHGEGPEAITVIYKLTAGGSAVQETVFPGTPMEMVTVYYDKGGKLGLTHYCMLQNRPEMTLSSSKGKTFSLAFDPSCGIDPKTEAHMNSVTFAMHGKNNMTQTWVFYEDGKKQHASPFKLTRTKS